MSSNTTLLSPTLPEFSSIKPDTIEPDVSKAIEHCKSTIESVLSKGNISWNELVLAIDDADDELSKLWSPISHCNSVVSSDELRAAHDACLPLLSEYSTWVGQHQGLFAAYQQLKESDEFTQLNQAQQKHIENTLRDFRLSGVDLPDDKKTRYAEISARLSELSSGFNNNVMDATMAFTKLVTSESELAGLPESALAAAKQLAESKDQKGWLFTLDYPSYLPVMMYSENRQLREEMYHAFVTRASDRGPNAGEFDNGDNILEILRLKRELAQLLGFDNYAQRSIATKMADSEEQVLSFLNDLAAKSKPQAEREIQEVRYFAKTEYCVDELQAWDIPFYSEKLKQKRYTISDEMLRPYFPEAQVVSGLFEVVHRLYDLNVVARNDVDIWHKDVKFYDIKDNNGDVRGSFYLDLYAREKKRGGAWMDECRVRRIRSDASLQLPVAYLTCNFNGPVGDTPALFTHDEVVTLFHEFGHGIHHMLTQIDVAGVSGINGVAWDAVELPSQFLENWCWQDEALAFISSHYESGDALPNDLLEKLLAARNFQSAMQMLRQLEFALFDFRLHQQDPENLNVQSFLDGIRKEVSVLTPPEFNRFQCSFSHIFGGGYAAGYYSYKWAEVLSSDAFSRFEEEGIFNPQTGKSFLNNILEKGGSEEPMELFKAFRGREPSVEPLLRHSGIAA